MISTIIHFILIISCMLSGSKCNADDLIVQLPEGQIRGHVLKSFNGADYYAFQEIPYAAPPVGENRFKEPKNPNSWDGILNTTENTKFCVQQQTYVTVNGTEDCLYLNVYTPQKLGVNAAPLPVFVWIHGGAYIKGSGTIQLVGPGFFMDYEIVLVSINYRLGPLGFLNTMDGVIPGNLGLKDQRHALRWVNKNIQLFGGDPSKVTIGGESAGAFSVAFQLLGQNSDGLFRGAIQASGTSMSRVSYTDTARDLAFQLGNMLDKNLNEQNSSAELLDVLQNASAFDIVAASFQVYNFEDVSLGYFGELSWAPVIENNDDSEDPFITAPMYESYMNGNFHKVPLMTGYNSEEILFFIDGKGCAFGIYYDADPRLMINRRLNIPSAVRDEVGKQLKDIYTKSFSTDLAACVKYSSDVIFQNPIVKQAKCTAKYAPVYLYRFAYVGELGGMVYPNGRLIIPGTESVGHSEDLMYTWQTPNVTISDADLLTVNRLHTLWTNFIKYLNPTPEKDELLQNVIWPTVTETSIKFFNFNDTLEVMSDPRYFQQIDALFTKYQEAPYNADDLIVQLPEGQIRGHVLKSFNGADYYAFQEIPYAAPPVGESRFKEPKYPNSWDGILNTTENTKICMQQRLYYITLNGTEDCLYLNVYTPQKPGSNAIPLPVFVWIHGGGYATGSGTIPQGAPGFFMDYEIIVVSINYRLGPFGFLNTMDGIIPGNLGLKDQRHALRWVNKNIQLFGGDPSKVTIGGESAGAFSVAFQLLGRNSDGLFRGAIQASGTSMARASYTDSARDFAFQLGNVLDKNFNEQNSSAELLEVLQNTPASDILAAGLQVHNVEDLSLGYLGEMAWAPVIENSDDSEDPFITAPMYESYVYVRFHKVPLMTGFNSEEILFFTNATDCPFGQAYHDDPSIMINRKLNIESAISAHVGQRMTEVYTNSFATDLAACVKYSSDVTFQNPIVKQAKLTSVYAPVYLYRFAYVGELGSIVYPNGRPVVPGTESVGHAEDLMYTWPIPNVTISDADLLTINRLHTLWTNFIKYLNPTPERDELLQNVIWPTVTESTTQFFNFNNTLEVMSDPRYFDVIDRLFTKYQETPYVTW